MANLKYVFYDQFADLELSAAPDPEKEFQILGEITDSNVSLLMKLVLFARSNPEVIPRIVELCADPTTIMHRTPKGYTPLMWAVTFSGSFGTEEIVSILLRHHPALESEIGTPDTGNLVAHTIRNANSGYSTRNTVHLLLEAGFDPIVNPEKSRPALHVAISCGDIICTDMLLQRGISVDTIDFTGMTPVMLSVTNDRMLTLLLKYGPNLEIAHPTKGTAFCLAMESGKEDCVRRLIAAGAKIEVAREDGKTPLHLAVSGRRHRLVEQLLHHGADPHRQDGKDASSLDLLLKSSAEVGSAFFKAGLGMQLLQLPEEKMSLGIKRMVNEIKVDRQKVDRPLTEMCLNELFPSDEPDPVPVVRQMDETLENVMDILGGQNGPVGGLVRNLFGAIQPIVNDAVQDMNAHPVADQPPGCAQQ